LPFPLRSFQSYHKKAIPNLLFLQALRADLQREYGRAPRGEKAEGAKRGKKFDRVNIIGALRAGAHFAVECYRRNANCKFFETWFADCLPPKIPKGYTVIMDNASFHHKKRLRKLARGKARLLFLPPYSPDYNSIEKSWADMKRFLRDNLKDFQSIDSAIYNYFDIIEN
jgi:transposase